MECLPGKGQEQIAQGQRQRARPRRCKKVSSSIRGVHATLAPWFLSTPPAACRQLSSFHHRQTRPVCGSCTVFYVANSSPSRDTVATSFYSQQFPTWGYRGFQCIQPTVPQVGIPWLPVYTANSSAMGIPWLPVYTANSSPSGDTMATILYSQQFPICEYGITILYSQQFPIWECITILYSQQFPTWEYRITILYSQHFPKWGYRITILYSQQFPNWGHRSYYFIQPTVPQLGTP